MQEGGGVAPHGPAKKNMCGRYDKPSCTPFTIGAEKELPDTASGPQLRSSESASAPRRALVVLRTPMYRVQGRDSLFICTIVMYSRTADDLGMSGATSLIPLHLKPGKILLSAQFRPWNQIVPAFGSRFAFRPAQSFCRACGIDPFGTRSISLICGGERYSQKPISSNCRCSITISSSQLAVKVVRSRVGLVLSRCFPNL